MDTQQSGAAWRWFLRHGSFDTKENSITFNGGKTEVAENGPPTRRVSPPAGALVGGVPSKAESLYGDAFANQKFSEGNLRATIEFDAVDENCFAGIIVQYYRDTNDMLCVTLGGGTYLVTLEYWEQESSKWRIMKADGTHANLRAGHKYDVQVSVQGRLLTLVLDDVEIANQELPFTLEGLQVGVFCVSSSKIHYTDFSIRERPPSIFVAIPFDSEYEALFLDVIAPVCDSLGLKAYRADSASKPGVVISHIKEQIQGARAMIAEVSRVNPNVYYEIGFADALEKPILFLVEAGVQGLPFDIRPFRAVPYDNRLGGRKELERKLRESLLSALSLEPTS